MIWLGLRVVCIAIYVVGVLCAYGGIKHALHVPLQAQRWHLLILAGIGLICRLSDSRSMQFGHRGVPADIVETWSDLVFHNLFANPIRPPASSVRAH